MMIRRARVADVEQMDRIAISAKASGGYCAEMMLRWRDELMTPPETIRAWPTFVAVVRSEVAGFAQLDPVRSPWALESLFVSPDHMGQGVGRALMIRAVAAARAAGERVIRIDADPNAADFYLASGARRVGTIAAPIPGHGQRCRPQFELLID